MIVVGHVARQAQAEALADSLNGQLLLDDGTLGAWGNHRRALQHVTEPTWILEDDAQPVDGFRELAGEWSARFPDWLISGYLGTGRPVAWQSRIERLIRLAERAGHDHLHLDTLIHGVCYSPPADMVPSILETMSQGPADFAIGRAWKRSTGLPVMYTLPSLVDHADGPSVEQHPDGQPRVEVRKAWRLP